ncbi:MAG: hypothetical protein CMJ75_13740 [Planctomycetaceae bacterium]|nr:hypothetical protein [Planctomycetaceae bacterium]
MGARGNASLRTVTQRLVPRQRSPATSVFIVATVATASLATAGIGLPGVSVLHWQSQWHTLVLSFVSPAVDLFP